MNRRPGFIVGGARGRTSSSIRRRAGRRLGPSFFAHAVPVAAASAALRVERPRAAEGTRSAGAVAAFA